MPLESLSGPASILRGPVNIGVVKNGSQALLVDTGIDENAVRKALREVTDAGGEAAAIFNTHHHADHCGGNAFVLSRNKALVFAPPIEEALIRNPILEPITLYGAFPPAGFRTKFTESPASPVHQVVTGGFPAIDRECKAIPLAGHTVNHHGLLVDDVLFAGDAVFGEATLAKHRLLFMQDPGEALRSLEKIRELGVATLVPAHGAPTNEIDALIAKNVESVTAASQAIAALFEAQTTIEDAFARLSMEWALSANLTSHHLNAATFKAHVASLQRDGLIVLETRDGRLSAHRIR